MARPVHAAAQPQAAAAGGRESHGLAARRCGDHRRGASPLRHGLDPGRRRRQAQAQSRRGDRHARVAAGARGGRDRRHDRGRAARPGPARWRRHRHAGREVRASGRAVRHRHEPFPQTADVERVHDQPAVLDARHRHRRPGARAGHRRCRRDRGRAPGDRAGARRGDGTGLCARRRGRPPAQGRSVEAGPVAEGLSHGDAARGAGRTFAARLAHTAGQGGARPASGALRACERAAAGRLSSLVSRGQRGRGQRRASGHRRDRRSAARDPHPAHHGDRHVGAPCARAAAQGGDASICPARPPGLYPALPPALAPGPLHAGRVGDLAEPRAGDQGGEDPPPPHQRPHVDLLVQGLAAAPRLEPADLLGLRPRARAERRARRTFRAAWRAGRARRRQSQGGRAAAAGGRGRQGGARRGDRRTAGLARGEHPSRRGRGDRRGPQPDEDGAARAPHHHRAASPGARRADCRAARRRRLERDATLGRRAPRRRYRRLCRRHNRRARPVLCASPGRLYRRLARAPWRAKSRGGDQARRRGADGAAFPQFS